MTTISPPQAPRLLRDAPLRDLAAFEATWGRRPPAGRGALDEIERAGIGGRGGAGFPLATKLRDVLAHRGGRTVVVNATEGEPASAKDVTLLDLNPHLVLDGAEAAAEVVGADTIVVCLALDAALADAVQAAASERSRARRCRFDVRVEQTPPRYLTGQETALVSWLNGGEVRPTTVPPRPSERGVERRATLVSNAETLANLALVARFGAAWYRQAGIPEAPGTRLVTVSGAVADPGVYEIEHGSPLADLLVDAGGDVTTSGGVLVGGYFGAWISPDASSVGLCDAGLTPLGASIGAGVIIVLEGGHCGLAETVRVLDWLVAESAGQCGPCVNGLPAMADAFRELAAGRGRVAHDEVVRLARVVDRRGACGLPDGAIRLVRSALRTFGPDIDAHQRRGPCRPMAAVTPTPPQGPWR